MSTVYIDDVRYVPAREFTTRQPLQLKLAEVRAAKKQNMTEAAAEIGIAKTYYWQLETGRNDNPSLETIRMILIWAGATFEEFFGVR